MPNCSFDVGDFDPHFALSDGNFIIGGLAADNDNGSFLGATFDDLGTTGANRNLFAGFENATYPSIDESFDINISFRLDAASTIVAAAFLSGSGSYSTAGKVLDPTAPLSFVFMPDGDEGERYQLNSVTLPVIPISSSIPEPAVLALITVGIAGIGFTRKRAT